MNAYSIFITRVTVNPSFNPQCEQQVTDLWARVKVRVALAQLLDLRMLSSSNKSNCKKTAKAADFELKI